MIFVTWLSCALAFGISGISKRFIPLFYGDDFIGVISLMLPLATSLIYIAWADVIRSQYLVPKGYDNSYVVSTAVGAIINLAVNIILIPKFGAMGAVVGTVCAELSVAIYVSFIAYKDIQILNTLKKASIFVLIGIVMMETVKYIGNIIPNPLPAICIQIITGAIIYFLLSFVYIRIFLPDVYKMILRRVHRTA